jgi:NADH-quinone oxidoreductase subunit M
MDEHLLSHRPFHPAGRDAVLLLIPHAEDADPLWANIWPGGLPGLAAAGAALRQRRAGLPVRRARLDWIPSLGVQYLIGIDGISLLLVMLTTLMGFLAISPPGTPSRTA